MSPADRKLGDRARLTERCRMHGYHAGDKGTVLYEPLSGVGGSLYYQVAMDKDDPSCTPVIVTEGEIEPDG